MLVESAKLSQRPADRRLLKGMLEKLSTLCIGKPEALLADAGYFSELNVESCVERGITPYIVPRRDCHHWVCGASDMPKTLDRERATLENVVPLVHHCGPSDLRSTKLARVESEKTKGEYLLGCTPGTSKRLHTLAMA